MKSPLALTLLLTLAAAPALAHSPRAHSPRALSPVARLDALSMPGLAPARALMVEMMHDLDRPPPRRASAVPEVPEVPARRVLPFFWGWFSAPLVVSRQQSPRCEVIYTPYAGRIETCTLAPLAPMPRLRRGAGDFDLWLDSR